MRDISTFTLQNLTKAVILLKTLMTNKIFLIISQNISEMKLKVDILK